VTAPAGNLPLGGLGTAWRFARRELRSGLGGFRIFLACLALGVAALAAVGTVTSDLLYALERDARKLLGGEVELRLFNRDLNAEERIWLEDNSQRMSAMVDLRAMAATVGDEPKRRLVQLKAVDGAYPLYGELVTAPPQTAEQALGQADGSWGLIAAPELAQRLDLAVGDPVKLGRVTFEYRGTIEQEPDRAARGVNLGPRAIIPLAALEETGLARPGALVYRYWRFELPEGEGIADWSERLNAAFPEAGWRIRGLDEATPSVSRFVNRVHLFMSLVGLTALLVGGIGVANAVRAHMESRRSTISTLKCLGAPAGIVLRVYLIQVMILAALGTGIGLVLGALAPSLLAPVLSDIFNVSLGGFPDAWPLIRAALMGLLAAALFAFAPLARAQSLPAASLFRGHIDTRRARWPAWLWPASLLVGAALVALTLIGSQDINFALGFLGGAALSLLLFRLAAAGIIWVARRLPRPRRAGWRLALANLCRPGAPTSSVVVSLGLGLTVLTAVALIQGNLAKQVDEEIPDQAPSFYFIDIQNGETAAFDSLVRNHPGVERMERVPMLRGRITAVDGVPSSEIAKPEDVAWVFEGDRGLTWQREKGADTVLTEGEWWPADYQGPPLISVSENIATALGLGVGDTLTVNVYGRDVTGEIANLRVIDWRNLSINFVMVFSPGLLEQAPASHIATVEIAPDQEAALADAVAEAFPTVSAIRVRDALDSFAEMLDQVANAVGVTGSITVLAGLLVLAGAIAAGERRRRYDAVVLKVLGATRRTLAGSLAIEFLLLGFVTVAIAAVLGGLAAWVVVTVLMQADFAVLAVPLAITLGVGLVFTFLLGMAGTWRALGTRAAPLLRNE